MALVHTNGLPVPRRYWAMSSMFLTLVVAVLDANIANVALPTIALQLEVSPASSVWVANAYQLATLIAILPMATLGEIHGYRRVYLAGAILFSLASLLCAVSGSLPLLIAARVVQGIGSAGVMSVNGALVRYIYPQSMLGRGIALNALVLAVSAAAGPSIASGILSVATWPWLFAINVPIGILAVVIGWKSLPDSDLSGARLDWVAVGLNAVAFALLFLGLDALSANEAALGTASLVGSAIAFVVLTRRVLGQRRPLIPLDLLRRSSVALTVLTANLCFLAQTLAFVSLAFFLQTTLGRNQIEAGLLITAWPIGTVVISPWIGRLAERYPAAALTAIGLGAMTVGLVGLALLPSDASTPNVLWRMALAGLGFGFFQTPNNRALFLSAPRERSGAAGGLQSMARLLGQTIGGTLAVLLFRFFAEHGPAIGLWTGAVVAALGTGVSLLRLGVTPPPQKVSPSGL